MKNKKILALFIAFVMIIAMIPSMGFADDAQKSDDIVILGTSDVHCGIDKNIGYDGLVAYRNAMKEKNKYVALVDCGDSIQGEAIGTVSKGEYIIDIMNHVGYDVLIPGNHEFDYGMDQFLNKIVKNSKTEYVACNFRTLADKKPIFKPYKMMTFGDKKVCFLGIATPETLAKSTPAAFQDNKGNWIYDFCNDETGKELYDTVQKAINEAKKEGANYIVALAHLGDAEETKVWKASDVIANTTGIDVLFDGHAHQTHVKTTKDKTGKEVTCVATGTKLENIGKVVIDKDGKITAENIDSKVATAKDAETTKLMNDIKGKLDALLKKVVAKTDVDLTTKGADGQRAVRSEETNLGDLCADAYKNIGKSDIAFVNGGGIRADIPKGDITYEQIISVHPFGNKLCVVEATGQEILEALELGSKAAGESESGGFLQVAGLTYKINTFIPSPVKVDDKGMFLGLEGANRVTEVMVNGQPLDLKKTYTLASHDYMLKGTGDGYTMFKDNKFLQEEIMLDNQVLINYITDSLKGVVGEAYKEPQGRIKIVNEQPTAKDKMALVNNKNLILKAKVVKGKKGKKAVMLTVKNNSGVEYDGIEIFRSQKKYSGYGKKPIMTTTKNKYKNTKVKKGQKYYYKVRAYIMEDGVKVYSSWSTKVRVVVK